MSFWFTQFCFIVFTHRILQPSETRILPPFWLTKFTKRFYHFHSPNSTVILITNFTGIFTSQILFYRFHLPNSTAIWTMNFTAILNNWILFCQFHSLNSIAISIRHCLSVQATKTPVSAFVLSRLDYCNSLLSGCPQYLLNRLRKVQNNAARLILKAPKTYHITSHFRTLHWLPIDARIKYKLCSVCFGAITSTGTVYLSDLLKIYTPSRQLRSSADIRILCIPSVNTRSYGERSFSYTAPTLWNTLLKDIRFSQSVSSFRSAIKTHFFPT